MIPRATANRFADMLGVDLHIAQQEVVLLYALDALSSAGILERLVFKGGTYLRLMVTGDVGRLSEDLDFTNAGLPDDPEPLLRECFARPHFGVQFSVRDPYRTERRNWACRVGYDHDWDEGEFRLEVSYREPTLLPARRWKPVDQPYFRALPFPPPTIPSLRVEEALAEKLRAIQQRGTERDLYDAIRYANKGFDADLARLLAVAKLWNDHEAFDPERILRTLSEGRREWPDLDRLIGRARRRNWNRELAACARRFEFLTRLSTFEKSLLADARRHALGKELVERLSVYALADRPVGSGKGG
ncbi:MAG TPA: nucleotidyl transferase AbiEii/AbiGii toxin family protein [Thermoplasmata archaeon]|nr:nucleotidyl transferase AbiEii/AbiGii toxin family protein [Thermoplasmata archaeon]